MWEFLQANSSWIILGIGFLLMMAMHGGHGSHGGAHGSQDDSDTPEPSRAPGSGTHPHH